MSVSNYPAGVSDKDFNETEKCESCGETKNLEMDSEGQLECSTCKDARHAKEAKAWKNTKNKPDYEDIFKANEDDIFKGHRTSEDGRYYDYYYYTDKDGNNPYANRVDQDGGETIMEGWEL